MKVEFYGNKKPPCMHRPRKQATTATARMNHKNLIWVPAIPSWEREFCYKIGLFKWENFLQAKKLTTHAHKVLEWNDSAAEEAFITAKNRFFRQINGLPVNQPLPNPDLYIDEIVWDDDRQDKDVINYHGGGVMKHATTICACESSDDDDQQEENVDDRRDYVPDYYRIPIEDIKPTGWDVDVNEFSAGKVLTGFVIGS